MENEVSGFSLSLQYARCLVVALNFCTSGRLLLFPDLLRTCRQGPMFNS